MKLLWLAQARIEFRQIAEGIAIERPQVVNGFERRVTTAVDHLRTFPDAGRRGCVEETREVVVYGFPYIVVYRVRDDQVQILTVRHAARGWPETEHKKD